MFIGHFAPAFAAKAARGSPSLAACFIAVQLVDIGFFSLAYFGIEKWRPDALISGIMPVDLFYMPYTHSLLGSALWALAAGALAFLVFPRGRKAIAGALIALLVFSHWLLDLVVHRHDLGILDNEPNKLGFGLWDRPMIEMPLEIALVVTGFVVYMSSTRPRTRLGSRMPWIVLVMLLILQCINWLAPPPSGAGAFSGLGLFAYALCALLAYGLDRTRESRPSGMSRTGTA